MRHFLSFGSRAIPAALVAAAAAGTTGCTRNYYYGNSIPVCEAPPIYAAPASIYGQVCEVPTRVGGAVPAGDDSRTIAAKPAIEPLDVPASPPPARVVSRPYASGEGTGFGNRLGWRSRYSDGGAPTRVSGSYEAGRLE